ncbi:MAG TPA: hypothetical protein VFV70_09565 [Hyphomonadaceae bacterium]|nr:hypothetical protein [Hyphomonadaceae bacterium]
MKLFLASSAVALAIAITPAIAPAGAQQPPVGSETAADGSVRVEGVAPSKVLGAIETEKLVDQEGKTKPEDKIAAQAPDPAGVVVDKVTTVEKTEDATVTKTTAVATPVSGRPELDPDNPIAPEVQAVVQKKKNYTTADIVRAQLEAVHNTPVSQPTTVTTTTTVIPDPG